MRRISKRKKKRLLTAAFTLILLAVSLVFTSLMGVIELPFEISAWSDVFRLAGIETATKVPDSNFSVTYLDVGQGDCSVIRSGNKTMLIDGGELDNADKILDFFKENGITKLDYVVATHPHSDHIGSLGKVISSMEVSNVIMPEIPEEYIPTTSVYENFLLAVQESGADVIAAERGSNYALGEADFKILSPVENDDELNNMSVVIKMTFGNNSFLFTGDAEKKVENELIKLGTDLSADVIKIGHHGSSTSTGSKFLKAVSPEIAVISVSEDNRYNHPSYDTLKRLSEYNVETYMTKDCGDIVITSDGNKLTVNCQKGD